MTGAKRRRAVLAVLILFAGCAPTSPPEPKAAETKPACRAGADARGLAAGFFAFFQDRPECF